MNVLRGGGVEVHRATRPFRAGGTEYAAGSHVLYAAQAFRPNLVNLLEPQVYPERRRFEGGRVLDEVDGLQPKGEVLRLRDGALVEDAA